MEIITDINTLQATPTVATIGSFDGVHLGHKAMLDEALGIADDLSLPLTAVTFARHPRLLFSGCETPFLLSSMHDKMSQLADAGVHRCVLLDFDHTMASLTAREFMHTILWQRLGVSLLAVGYDHRFGRPQTGEGLDDYMAYGQEVGMRVVQMQCFAPSGESISSSKIRGALMAGDVRAAAQMLGRNYSIAGSVVHGEALGRRLGFPTANILPEEPLQLLPLDGVYECLFHVGVCCYRGVMNIGCKPTLDNATRTIEVYAIGLTGDIYGEKVKVEFVRRLRGERRFSGLDDLRGQIELDVKRVIDGIS